MVNIVVKY